MTRTQRSAARNSAQAHPAAPRPPVIVHGALDDYEAYARRTDKDPAERQARRDYGEWCAANRPERTLAWPPPRNGPCWCGSERKYKKCCGSASRT